MAIRTQVIRQRDFSAGQLVEHGKRRDDEPLMLAGLRTAENVRLLASGAFENRPGRRLLFSEASRIDEVRMKTGVVYRLCFDDGILRIRDSLGAAVFTITGMPWVTSNIADIVWARFEFNIVVCFPGMVTRVLFWDGVSTWTQASFAFNVERSDVLQMPFYRFAASGVSLNVSAKSGAGITVTASEPYFTPEHVGARLTWIGSQLSITGFTSSTVVTATAVVDLPATVVYSGTPVGAFVSGDKVAVDAVEAQVIAATAVSLTVNHFKAGELFANTQIIKGPTGQFTVTGSAIQATGISTIWEEAAFSTLRGWPQSVAADRGRLIFCDHPLLPDAIFESAIGVYNDFEVGADATDAIFEFAPNNARVYHVLGGGDQFVFTDQGVFNIPISESNPLRPGSVTFREITPAGSSSVRPVPTADGVVYVPAGKTRITAIQPTGQVAQPWIARDVSDLHADIIVQPKCLAASNGEGEIPERYVFAVNSDGSVAVGRYQPGREWVGWVPWTTGGGGAVTWISALMDNVVFSTRHDNGPTTDTTEVTADTTEFTADAGLSNHLVEILDADVHLDAAYAFNHPEDDQAQVHTERPAGQGPFYYLIGSDVDVMDGTNILGTRTIDNNGFIIPEEGDNLTALTLVVGRAWEMKAEPFIPHAQPGPSARQSMRRRRIRRGTVTVQKSTGFVAGTKRFTPWRQGEDQSIAPPEREETVSFAMLGRSHDPRIEIRKDTPGPLRVLEIGFEVTV